MIHYHGTPITPMAALYELAGRSFCVSFARPADVTRVHQIGESVLLDNGAFSQWKIGTPTNWPRFYAWADRWLDYPTTWAVIPDAIGGGEEANNVLLIEWPHGERGAPVWHMDEPIARLLRLLDGWSRVCVGSSGRYDPPLSPAWERRMDEAWNAISRRHRRTPNVHMLRGMNCAGERWPFASVDSTDIARNHNRPENTPKAMAEAWNAKQSPGRWIVRPEQLEMIA